MTSITHPKARSLLQMAADHTLTSFEHTNLNSHLAECEECREYAESLAILQNDLRRVTRQKWSRANIKISTRDVRARAIRYDFLTFGKFATATVILAFMFIMTANFSGMVDNIPAVVSSSSITPEWPLVTATPSIQKTATDFAVAKCSDISYLVHEGDTLESIAARHSVSVEAIKQRNGLSASTLTSNTLLAIPVCGQAPANSTLTPTLTSTATP